MLPKLPGKIYTFFYGTHTLKNVTQQNFQKVRGHLLDSARRRLEPNSGNNIGSWILGNLEAQFKAATKPEEIMAVLHNPLNREGLKQIYVTDRIMSHGKRKLKDVDWERVERGVDIDREQADPDFGPVRVR